MPEMQGEQSIVIQAPIEDIYAYVSDFPRHIEWNHQPAEMTKLTDGPIGVGTRFRTIEQPASNMNWFMAKIMFPVVGMLLGVKGYTEAEITALTPNESIKWKANAPIRSGDMMRAEWGIGLESVEDGTKVTQHFHFMPQHPMAKRMVSESMKQDIATEVARNLEKLKSIITS
jgi:uncharacterized membrane protein